MGVTEVRINIHIEDATPAELKEMFGGQHVTITAANPVNAGKAKALRSNAVRWLDDERAAIAVASSNEEAWILYHEKFPTSKRLRNNVRRMWDYLKDNDRLVPKKEPATASSTKTSSKSARADIWSDEEKNAIKDCPDQKAAVKRYRKKFPKSTRKIWAIEQRWYILTKEKRGASTKPDEKRVAAGKDHRRENATAPVWTPEQEDLVSKCKTKEDAWKKFQEVYPGQRNENAVHQRFNKLKHPVKKPQPEKKPEKPPAVPAKKPAPVPDKKPDPVPATPPTAKKTETLVYSSGILTPAVSENKEPTYPATQAFSKDMKVRYTGVHPQFQGSGIVKRVNQISGEVLVDIKNGLEWIPGKDLAAA